MSKWILVVLAGFWFPAAGNAQWLVDAYTESDMGIAAKELLLGSGRTEDEQHLGWLADNQTVVYYNGASVVFLNTTQKKVARVVAIPARQGSSQRGIVGISVSADGTTIATHSRESVRGARGIDSFYDVNVIASDGKYQHRIENPIGYHFRRLLMTPDGHYGLLTGWPPKKEFQGVGAVSLVDLATGQMIGKTFGIPAGMGLDDAAISLDKKYMVTYESKQDGLIFWDLESGEALPVPSNFDCRSVEFSPSQASVVALRGNVQDPKGPKGLHINAVLLWDVSAKAPVRVIAFKDIELSAVYPDVSFSLDGKLLALRGGGASAIIDVAAGAIRCKAKGRFSAMALSPDGTKFATFAEDSNSRTLLQLWDCQTCNQIPFERPKVQLKMQELN